MLGINQYFLLQVFLLSPYLGPLTVAFVPGFGLGDVPPVVLISFSRYFCGQASSTYSLLLRVDIQCGGSPVLSLPGTFIYGHSMTSRSLCSLLAVYTRIDMTGVDSLSSVSYQLH